MDACRRRGDRELSPAEAVDPIAEFRAWLAAAAPHEFERGTAAALATAGDDGRPSVRMVLLKAFDEGGFCFYTNYESRKARELEATGWAALCFFWASLERQVRVEGTVARSSVAESDAYFATRPRASQLGAWASRQSAPLPSRVTLLRRVAATEARFFGGTVPRPPFWGGYRLRPESVEFWQSKTSRLHDRRLYTRGADGWRVERLYP